MKGPILILASLLLAGCSPKQTAETEHPTVFVSIPPQAGILKTLVGDTMEIRTLVGEGQSPHSYEPTARQLAALGDANMLFTVGVPFEEALLKKIRPLYPDLPIIETDDAIEKRVMPHAHHGEECSHNHGESDPHIWLSARNVVKMASAMQKKLESSGLANQVQYDALIHTLKILDAETTEKLAPYKAERFYVFHPSFGYFADAYGLVQVPIELDGKSPSPRQLANLIEMAQTDGVKVIFVQKQFPMESARAVADAIGGRVVQLDPLDEDVVANLRQIAEAVVSSYE
ncbi:metal ABC transporter solute-binding protein, Zn/Mn family [Pontiella agarivorans]|uniref:Zinc ABC transporter substrate-binding protein n=1 Tax=Pontiella agarivorans TaxID=3038953 RepID=A0ABU5MUH1_9BACT|nr:zinc ABC transporter substrate-binding protein [Pontiella agarivorans]MDZ8117867.1 zinc ABC transporter substrate-binding protein [Pontiella agarivorans]